MAATSNAPAPFGPPKTHPFPHYTPYHSLSSDDGPSFEQSAGVAGDLSFDRSSPMLAAPAPVQQKEEEADSQAMATSQAPQPVNDSESNPPIDGSMSDDVLLPPAGMENMSEAMSTQISQSVQHDLESYEAEAAAAVDLQPVQAFALLKFPDGDFYVTTNAVEVGKDMGLVKHEKRMRRLARRRAEIERCEAAGEIMSNGVAPSHSSQMRAKEAMVKEGANISEVGGIVGVTVNSSSDEGAREARRRKKMGLPSDSSQSQSIAPASLHANWRDNLDEDSLEIGGISLVQNECPLLQIHPKAGQSTGAISKRHIRIEFNSDKGYWELKVLGRNGAFIDKETYLKHQGLDPEDIVQELEEEDEPKHLAVDEVIRLRHGSEVQVSSISIGFRLPVGVSDEDEVVGDESVSGSDAEKVEEVEDKDRQDSGTQSDIDEAEAVERPKIKLSLAKKKAEKVKLSLKAGTKRKRDGEVSAEPDAEPTDVRPSIETDTSATPAAKPKVEEEGTPAVPAADLPAGSILHGVAPSEMPQKRKGPGRPPKNGVMSKRDEAIIKRLRKEYHKRGEEPPSLAELLVQARKEGATTTKSDGKADDANGGGAGGASAGGAGSKNDDAPKTQNPAEIEAAKARKLAKSPSPQKPESEYTEEELKKPSKTYVLLIYDALSNSATGVMDLQQIYDAIQKMYPYYKYRSQTTGWQSSIRHNLIGSPAFKEAGKIGKGRLWTIDSDYPIDKEKKRRTSPSTDRPSYPYSQGGQYSSNNTNGQQGYPAYRPSPYGAPYGSPSGNAGARGSPAYPQNRPGTYQSPYAAQPAGQGQQSPYNAQNRPPYAHAHAPNHPANQQSNAGPQNGVRPGPGGAPPNGPPRPNGQAGPAGAGGRPAPGPPGQGQGNDDTIEEIMAYHKRFLNDYHAGVDKDAARNLFRKAVNRHIDQKQEHGPYESETERIVTETLGKIIARNKESKKGSAAAAAGGLTPAGAATPPPRPGVPGLASVPASAALSGPSGATAPQQAAAAAPPPPGAQGSPAGAAPAPAPNAQHTAPSAAMGVAEPAAATGPPSTPAPASQTQALTQASVPPAATGQPGTQGVKRAAAADGESAQQPDAKKVKE